MHQHKRSTHPLLLHQLAVGAIVDDISAEDGSGQDAVDLFSVDVLGLAVQNELVALGADVDGGLLAKENKGKDIAKLAVAVLVNNVMSKGRGGRGLWKRLTLLRFSTKNRGGSMP